MFLLFAPYTYVPWYRRVGEDFGIALGFGATYGFLGLVFSSLIALGQDPFELPLAWALGPLAHLFFIPLMISWFERFKVRADEKRRRWGWIS